MKEWGWLVFIGTMLCGCIGGTTMRSTAANLAMLHRSADQPIAVRFPARLAVTRIQYDRRQAPHGPRAVATVDVLEADDLDRLAALPSVREVVPFGRGLVPQRLDRREPLLDAARTLEADVLFVYTLETDQDFVSHFAPIGLLTLGLAPNHQVRTDCTAFGVLIDVRSGAMLGTTEASGERGALATGWGAYDTSDRVARKAERDARQELLGGFEGAWMHVLKEFGPSPTP